MWHHIPDHATKDQEIFWVWTLVLTQHFYFHFKNCSCGQPACWNTYRVSRAACLCFLQSSSKCNSSLKTCDSYRDLARWPLGQNVKVSEALHRISCTRCKTGFSLRHLVGQWWARAAWFERPIIVQSFMDTKTLYSGKTRSFEVHKVKKKEKNEIEGPQKIQ